MKTSAYFAAIFAAGFATHISAVKASSESVVYEFCAAQNCSDGSQPRGGLVDVDGTLYGTTEWGGMGTRYGTVFSLDPTTGAETVLHSFTDTPDGAGPVGSLVDVGGVLYGVTLGGGAQYGGTLFSIDPATGAEKVLHAFGGTNDGMQPEAGPIAMKGKLYGTTAIGGTGQCESGCGTVFSINPATGSEKILYSFQKNSTDGIDPYADLLNVGGTLYGTTLAGGAGSCACGTVFSIDPTTGAETVLHTFQDDPDGSTPFAGLTNVNGTLYGMTYSGGAYGRGAIFSVNPTTGEEAVVYSFQDPETEPVSDLITIKGTLYGTTYSGGSGGSGEVFAFKPATGTLKVLYSFCPNGFHDCKDGRAPYAPLVAVDGTLYGTTYAGGIKNTECAPLRARCGTVFAVQLP